MQTETYRAGGSLNGATQEDALKELVAFAWAALEDLPESALTHSSAAALWGMPGGDFQARPLHLWRPAHKASSLKGPLKVWHTAAGPGDIVNHPATGLPVTSRRLTLLIASRTWPLDTVVAAIDWMVRHPRPSFEQRSDPYDTLEGISAWLVSLGRRQGAPRVREALSLARVGSDSPMETALRLALQRHGLPEPVCNGLFPLAGPDACPSGSELFGPLCFQPDLAYPAWRVAVEYQGSTHASAASMRRDITKKHQMEQAGWAVVQIHSGHMAEGAARAADLVRAALRRQGWPGPGSPRLLSRENAAF